MEKINVLLFAVIFVVAGGANIAAAANYNNWTANWMGNLPQSVVKSIPLVQLSIPGSHDSFSYNLSLSMAPPIAIRYAKSQDWNVSMQLLGGIRYFDLRIYQDAHGVFRFYHGYVKGGLAVIPTLSLVRDFLTQHLGEVVVLHFQAFDNIPLDKHRVLIDSVLGVFGSLVAPKCAFNGSVANITLQQLRAARQQIFLVSYDPMTAQVDACNFWNASALINPYYPTTQVQTMANTLATELRNRTVEYRQAAPDLFFVYQSVLTPDADYILHHLEGSLKQLALPATQFVAATWMPSSVRTNCTNAGYVNIVMCDFVDQFNFAEQVALANWNFTTCPQTTTGNKNDENNNKLSFVELLIIRAKNSLSLSLSKSNEIV